MGRMKKISMDGGNVECKYAFYGLNRLRCAREGNTGEYCQYCECEYFEKELTGE